jgi:hypothetical protein
MISPCRRSHTGVGNVTPPSERFPPDLPPVAASDRDIGHAGLTFKFQTMVGLFDGLLQAHDRRVLCQRAFRQDIDAESRACAVELPINGIRRAERAGRQGYRASRD